MNERRATSTRLRALGGALLATALLLLSACSYITEFVVVNDSGSPVEVTYTFKRWHKDGECCPEQPSKKALDKLEDDDTRWTELRKDEFKYEAETGAVTVTLGPGEVLRVDRQSNWRGHGDRNDDDNFDLASVRVAGANGVIYYEGRQAQYQFQWKSDSLYKLTYYGWGDKSYGGGR